MFYVINNVTGQTASRGYETEDGAISVCRALNIEAGPGGLYGVEERSGMSHCPTCRC